MEARRAAAILLLISYVVSLAILWSQGLEKTLAIKDYISDEVWYVPAAVNVARDILGVTILPRLNSTTLVYTIVYDNTSCSKNEVESTVLHALPGSRLLNRSYEKLPAFAIAVPSIDEGLVGGLVENNSCIVDVMPGVAPDSSGINTYLNTEHPPLVKYILAASIMVLGWRPLAWRLPSFIAAAIGLGAAAYIAYLGLVEQKKPRMLLIVLVALILPVYVLRDPAIKAMSSVAMLDIYAAAFDAVAVAAAAKRRWRLAGLALGLSVSSKYTGGFILPLLLLAEALDTGSWRKAVADTVLLPLLVSIILWAPFAAAKGPGWLADQIASAIAWHTTSRPPGPPSTNPLGLILGRNGFVLYYIGNKPYIAAVCNPGVCATSVILGAAAAVAALTGACIAGWSPRRRLLLTAAASPTAAWLGYAAVYAAGNHTLYSFYSVQISLLGAASLTQLPLLLDEAHWLAPSRLRLCLETPRGVSASSALAAFTGLAASAALTRGWPPGTVNPAAAPLAAALQPEKLLRLGLFAAAALLYPTAAYRAAKPGRRLEPLRWLVFGLLAYSAPLAPLAPVILAALARPGPIEGLLAGLVSPTPLISAPPIGDRRGRAAYTAAYILGYLAAWQLALPAPSPGQAAEAAAEAMAAALLAPAGSLALLLASAAAAAPSLLPLLAATPGLEPAAALALIAVAAGATWAARLAALAAAIAVAADIYLGSGKRNIKA